MNTILLLTYNRPEVTQRLINHLAAVRPPRLLVAADGPKDSSEDRRRCEEVRKLFESLPWECSIERKFLAENQGCARAVSSAISWAFEKEDRIIILEDDCLPEPSFFSYCEELLQTYLEEKKVGSISGDNFQFGQRRSSESYYFSIYPHCWGWATWRRAWKHFDFEMKTWPAFKSQGQLAKVFSEPSAIRYWTNIFDLVYENKIDSWAYRWTFSCFSNFLLTTIPAVNLVSNIGFSRDATHTKERHSSLAEMETFALKFPLHHPLNVAQNLEADRFTQETIFEPSILRRTWNWIQGWN